MAEETSQPLSANPSYAQSRLTSYVELLLSAQRSGTPVVLDFRESYPSPSDWLDLLRLKRDFLNITSVYLGAKRGPTEKIFAFLEKLPKLELLQCGWLDDTDMYAISNLNIFKKIHILDISRCNRLSDKSAAKIASITPNLTGLGIDGCTNLSDMALSRLFSKINPLDSLSAKECLQLSENTLGVIISRMGRLKRLELAHCGRVSDYSLKEISTKLSDLIFLDLSACTMVTDEGVKSIASRQRNLSSLSLAGCRSITDVGIAAIANGLPQLTHLTISGCDGLTDEGVKIMAETLIDLIYLDMSMCRRVTDDGIDAIAGSLKHLGSLDLSGCKSVTDIGIKRLVARSVKLNSLHLLDMPHLRVPKELLQSVGSPSAIRAFYQRGEKEGVRQLNEAKLILVGNEAVGKTAIVNYLAYNQPCSDSPKTEGVQILDRINVANWNVEKGISGESPLRLNVWDFGGQEVLYETHRFFLTARSIYLVVIEARRENTFDAEANLVHWMRAIRNRGGEEVPVIVVVNKAEPPHDLRLDERRLCQEFPAIRAFVRTSCRDPLRYAEGGKGIADLRRLLVDIVRSSLPHVTDWFPESYFRVKETIGALARCESTLATARYIQTCLDAGVTSEIEQDALLTLLDQIGVVVRHSHTTLLDPNWLTTAVYRILTHSAVVQAGGEFDVNDLGQLLADLQPADRYPKRLWPYIADMMSQFNLSFELYGLRGKYLVPLQLPIWEPVLTWDSSKSLRFRYDYDSLPFGLIPRFIVEMHRFLTDRRTAWVSGIAMHVDGCMVLVKANRQLNHIQVYVNGPDGLLRGALAIVRAGFAAVHAFYEDLRIVPMVPVDVPSNPNAALSYDQLLASERLHVGEVVVDGAARPFSVKKLLDGVGPEPRHNQLVRDRSTGDFYATRSNINVRVDRGAIVNGSLVLYGNNLMSTIASSDETNIDNSLSVNSQSGAKSMGQAAKATDASDHSANSVAGGHQIGTTTGQGNMVEIHDIIAFSSWIDENCGSADTGLQQALKDARRALETELAKSDIRDEVLLQYQKLAEEAVKKDKKPGVLQMAWGAITSVASGIPALVKVGELLGLVKAPA